MFLETYPFLLLYPICWHIIVHSGLLWWFVYFCGITCNVSSFIYNSESSILFNLDKGLSILSFPKTNSYSFIVFLIAFLVSISFISALILIISFLLLTLDLICSYFSNTMRCRLFTWKSRVLNQTKGTRYTQGSYMKKLNSV